MLASYLAAPILRRATNLKMNRAAVAIGASNKRLVGLPCLQAVEMKISTQIINERLSVEGGPVVAGVAID